MPTTTTDLKSEIEEVIRALEEAKKDINVLESIREGLDKGTEEFDPKALKNAKRTLLGNLTKAHTKISEIIAETTSV